MQEFGDLGLVVLDFTFPSGAALAWLKTHE